MSKDNTEDRLDKAIDELFKAEPIAYSQDLTDRILSASEIIQPKPERFYTNKWFIRYGFAAAAAIACALFILPSITEKAEPSARVTTTLNEESELELQEIFALEESLEPFAAASNLDSLESLSLTLSALLFETES